MASYVVGVIYGSGLMLSGVLRPSMIIGFLTLSPGWDPSLLILMCTVVVTDFLIFYLVQGKPQPSQAADYTLLDLDDEAIRLDQEEGNE